MFEFPKKMLPVFKDPAVQEIFERDGYVVLPFYNEQEIKELSDLYYELHPVNEHGFFPSTFSHDKNYRQTADSSIRKACERSANLYLENVKLVCGAFIVKTPSPESGMCVHQDMSLLDESRFTGINIWATLCDLSVENGTIFVLKGSHRLFPTYRGSSIPEFFQNVSEEIIDYLEPVLIKAGEAVFFDQSIIHYSPPNYSNKIRIVTNTYFTHKDAEYRTYFYNPELDPNKVEAFEQSDSFMTDFEQFGNNIHERPKVGKSLGLVEYNFPKIDAAYLRANFKPTNARELINAVQREHQKTPKGEGFLSRLKGLFS
ncbi:MAG: phytanoyl-CoA dioxygenase family protein [Chitinophagales bacterium]|nr:phytanoyl-CoA dioxygenase family protein [Bacteroidota bacterium]MCB9256496.1 phytanoyl-CoA dioxygenase family protein [Chitinophagales bacterium]